MSDKKFDLGDYVEVKDRIKLFYELYGQGRLVTGEVRLTTEPDGVPRVLVQAFAYRSPDDPLPGVGWSWLELPGKTTYTKGSEVENAETSAWGRAIGSLGILIDRSIASANEVQNKQEPATPASVNAQERERLAASDDRKRDLDGRGSDGSLIGTVEVAKDFPDFMPRIGPEGPVLAFKLTSAAGGIKVIATGPLAEVLALSKDSVLGHRVSCWGRIRDEAFTPKGTRKAITYQVLDLERIKGPDFTLPADDDALPEPPDDVPLVGESPALGLVR